MLDIQRRVAALERKTDEEKLVLLFASCLPDKRLGTMYRGEAFTQADDESAEDFQRRVRDQIEKDGRTGTVLVWCNETDLRL